MHAVLKTRAWCQYKPNALNAPRESRGEAEAACLPFETASQWQDLSGCEEEWATQREHRHLHAPQHHTHALEQRYARQHHQPLTLSQQHRSKRPPALAFRTSLLSTYACRQPLVKASPAQLPHEQPHAMHANSSPQLNLGMLHFTADSSCTEWRACITVKVQPSCLHP